MTREPEITMVPRDLYYHEISYVRGLETEVERLRAESDISDGLLADARTEIEQLRTLIYRNCNAMTTNDKDAKTIQEIAAMTREETPFQEGQRVIRELRTEIKRLTAELNLCRGARGDPADKAEIERLKQHIYTLKGMLGEMNMPTPEEPKPT